MWIVSYIRIFVERFIVVYPFYLKKKNRAHARLWNIKKWNVKAYEFQFRIISLCFEFWCRKYITGHNAKPKWFRCRYIIKFECLAIYQVQNLWVWICNISRIFHSGGMCDEKTVEYLRDLIAERQVIEEHVTGNRNKPHLQSESDCIKTTTDNNPSTSSHPTTSSGCTKSIAQRLLDQG